MNASEYRAAARENLRGNWYNAMLAAIIACLLGGLITGSAFLPNLEWRNEVEDFNLFVTALSLLVATFAMGAGLMGVVCFVIGGVVEIGYASYLLEQSRGNTPNTMILFSRFDHFLVGFLQNLLRSIFIGLWSLLLVVPGIMAYYSYSMTAFILAENPDMTAMDGIRASKTLMNGHKWELFCLDFSFIGWNILCGLTLNLGNIALNPYKNAAHAVFYKNISKQSLF